MPGTRGRSRDDRARAVVDAWTAAGSPTVIPTRYGAVRVAGVTLEGAAGGLYVGVRLHPREGGESDYRVVNPPLLVADPDGDIVTGSGRHRYDPVAALAEVIGGLGAATAPRRRRRRR